MFSSRSFIVSGLTFRSLFHFEFIFDTQFLLESCEIWRHGACHSSENTPESLRAQGCLRGGDTGEQADKGCCCSELLVGSSKAWWGPRWDLHGPRKGAQDPARDAGWRPCKPSVGCAPAPQTRVTIWAEAEQQKPTSPGSQGQGAGRWGSRSLSAQVWARASSACRVPVSLSVCPRLLLP